MASKKIPCGGFGYDDNDFEFVTPVGGGIPTLKSKGGAVPEEVTNAIDTNGMGWTDEDETVHQIDEKYIPSSGGGAITYEFNLIHVDGDDPIVRTEANPVTVKEHLENGDNVRFIVKYLNSEESEDYNSLMTTNNITIIDGVEIVGSVVLGDLIGAAIDEGAYWTFDIKNS